MQKQGKVILTAKHFLSELKKLSSATVNNLKFYAGEDETSSSIGVSMKTLFVHSKKYMHMPLDEIIKLLNSEYYEARMGAVSIMDYEARDKKTTLERKKELYELYITKHDRIDNWDLVDRSAPYIVGGYLFDKPRKILYKLAKSKNVWERRTSIVATYYFIRQNQIEDTFAIAEILVHDKHDLINKAVGSWIREAGKRDKKRLLNFLNKYAVTMPRVTLRYAIEKLDKKEKEYYLQKAK